MCSIAYFSEVSIEFKVKEKKKSSSFNFLDTKRLIEMVLER